MLHSFQLRPQFINWPISYVLPLFVNDFVHELYVAHWNVNEGAINR